jgi:penicillin-binding protein 1A
MDPNTAYQLIEMMRGVIEGGTASRTVGGLGFEVAGKTGTTNDNKDAWFVGFTRNLVAGCFIGYDTPRDMGRGSFGGTLCGPVFREFMKEAHAEIPPGRFLAPQNAYGTVTIKVHAETGERLPDDAEGPHVLVKVFDLGSEPEILVADRRVIDDFSLFTGSNARLLALLPEGDDVPLGESAVTTGADGAITRDNVGLGTGGLY